MLKYMDGFGPYRTVRLPPYPYSVPSLPERLRLYKTHVSYQRYNKRLSDHLKRKQIDFSLREPYVSKKARALLVQVCDLPLSIVLTSHTVNTENQELGWLGHTVCMPTTTIEIEADALLTTHERVTLERLMVGAVPRVDIMGLEFVVHNIDGRHTDGGYVEAQLKFTHRCESMFGHKELRSHAQRTAARFYTHVEKENAAKTLG